MKLPKQQQNVVLAAAVEVLHSLLRKVRMTTPMTMLLMMELLLRADFHLNEYWQLRNAANREHCCRYVLLTGFQFVVKFLCESQMLKKWVLLCLYWMGVVDYWEYYYCC